MNAREKFEKIITDVELYIGESYREKEIDIAKMIAKDMLMGIRELSEVFKFLTGDSLIYYIKGRKMMTAYRSLICNNKLNIEMAIDISGLGNHSSFATKFKAIFGMTPTEAFEKKDKSKIVEPLSWSAISSSNLDSLVDKSTDEEGSNMIFGIKAEQYNKIVEAQEYQALYDLSAFQSEIAFKIAKKDDVTLKESFELVYNYIDYIKYIKGETSFKDELLDILLTSKTKKLRYLFFNVTNSVSGALVLIDEAEECDCDIYTLDLEALYIYYKEPLCDFEEFLSNLEDFNTYGGTDFEEYYDLIHTYGFSSEAAAKRTNVTDEELDREEEVRNWIFEKTDSIFDKWAEEETDFSDKIDEEYDSDNPCYSDEEDEDIE